MSQVRTVFFNRLARLLCINIPRTEIHEYRLRKTEKRESDDGKDAETIQFKVCIHELLFDLLITHTRRAIYHAEHDDFVLQGNVLVCGLTLR